MRPYVACLIAGLAAASPQRVSAASPWPPGVDLPAGEPVDEDYRQQFALCDSQDLFRGHPAHGCAGANRVAALRRLPGGAIAYVSKLAVDLDGSPFACSADHGPMDQCPTSLMLPDAAAGTVPVDADKVAYVVIPAAGPPNVQGEFGRLTGLRVGDFGLVIANGRTVPVIVADTGPFPKLGEGSMALHRALGRELCAERDADGTCVRVVAPMESIEGDVTTILFPGTARGDLTSANIDDVLAAEGAVLSERYRRLAKSRRTDRRPPDNL